MCSFSQKFTRDYGIYITRTLCSSLAERLKHKLKF